MTAVFRHGGGALLLAAFVLTVQARAGNEPARGPLRANEANPRYFTDGSGRAMYLTGAHTWNNLQDMSPTDPPEKFDFERYLDFLQRHRHNFIRLWCWELTRWDTAANRERESRVLFVAPHPWARSGPGQALDGKPRFDLERFDEPYFERLRSRVAAARERGIYVAVMLFEGWGLQHIEKAWQAHPFHPANNVNRIDGDADGDGRGLEVHTLRVPAVTAIQENYVRKVIDTVNDLDNVLYEIANESGAYSTEWQEHMVRFIKRSERDKPRQHPVGMTFQYSRDQAQRGSNRTLVDGPADWISPNPQADRGFDYRTNPPPADGTKVVVSDTDHLWGIGGDPAWVWKSFCRGLNPIFMDPYDHRVLTRQPDAPWEAVRQALGHTRQLADRIDLTAMTPQDRLASTGYCLARPGAAYVVYLPEGGRARVDLSAATGELRAEWLQPATGKWVSAEAVRGGSERELAAPFSGHAVLYLRSTRAGEN